jgi:gas vesicle protein
MEKIHRNGKRSIALPIFLAGLGTGIALTALLVPNSGAKTRRLIGRKVEEGEDWMKAKASEAQDYVSSRGAELRDRAKEVAEVMGRS